MQLENYNLIVIGVNVVSVTPVREHPFNLGLWFFSEVKIKQFFSAHFRDRICYSIKFAVRNICFPKKP